MTTKSPWRSIVHDHALGQPVTPEGVCQQRMYCPSLHVATGLETNRKTGMVIKNRQRITAASLLHREISFEIHLPETIRRFMHESLPGLMLRRFFGVESSMPPEDLRDRTWTRYRGKPSILKNSSDLASTPGGIFIPNSQYHLFELISRSSRTIMRTLRAIFQSTYIFSKIPGYPLISRLGAYLKATTQLPYVRVMTKSKCYKLITQRHSRIILPGHDPSPYNGFMKDLLYPKCVTYVSEHVLPISPVCTPF
jgi:hypothetical protein